MAKSAGQNCLARALKHDIRRQLRKEAYPARSSDQRAAPPGADSALGTLARALALPEGVIRMVVASKCETPAGWRFAKLAKLQRHEAVLWNAVQSIGALDSGARIVIVKRARRRAGRHGPSRLQGVLKPCSNRPRRPFNGTSWRPSAGKSTTARGNELRTIRRNWPGTGRPKLRAKGCLDIASEQAQGRFQKIARGCMAASKTMVLTDAARAWSKVQGYCKQGPYHQEHALWITCSSEIS